MPSVLKGFPIPPQVDRFRIATNRNHVLVVDTVTGQVWEKYVKTTEGTVPRCDP